ncbi:hypothetical protein WOLCODRAFT_159920 [Wolfiporia cocos MD-104 SS10]|uniref:Protein kinase domain-containing protein n=1 Tax=Wolfiporia cocos (strain MD-104) TaxID=742152 RepID=A0A2H3IUX2_WOLCO|nr:hypothetical protein WOLCODRAFT_159920 [Wolfiporia cocos MD-104 SS10]
MCVALVPPPLCGLEIQPVCATPVPGGVSSIKLFSDDESYSDKSDVEDITFYDDDIGEDVQDDILSESIIGVGTEGYGFEQAGSIEEDEEDLFPSTAAPIDLMRNLLSSEAHIRALKHIDGIDVEPFIDLLDLAVATFGPSDHQVYQRSYYLLKKICTKHRRLPRSYYLSSKNATWETYPCAGGRYGWVFKGEFEKQHVALKAIGQFNRRLQFKLEPALIKETLIWKQLRHPNILPFLGVIVDDDHTICYIVSPWMSKGNLTKYLAQRPNADRLALIRQ